MSQVKYHFLLFLCFSIVRGQINDCKFVIKLFVQLVFCSILPLIVQVQQGGIGCVSDDGRRM
jgi:hypothetical protein